MREYVDIWIAGAAGDGVQSTAEILGRTAARSGLHVLIYNSYQSAIRGGYVYAQVKISLRKARLPGDNFNILLCLNADSLTRHRRWAKPDGLFIFNKDRASLSSPQKGLGISISRAVANPIMQNAVFLGSACAICGIPLENLNRVIFDVFRKKTQEIQQANIAAAQKGWDLAREFKGSKTIATSTSPRFLLTGNQALALGAAQGGVRFYTAYPMTPATGVLHWITDHAERLGIIVEQAEDEIAVINMAIGASFTGARSMLATSGGGFSLMTEAIGEAAMTETPLVVLNVSRAGPSTGVPTKTEQGDLWQVLGASQGDYPKAVLTPLDAEDAFYMVQTALNLADRYQIPVILLSDLLLCEGFGTVAGFDPQRIPIDRGLWAASPHLSEVGGAKPQKDFKRYLFTETGVSPRAQPGSHQDLIFMAASDEHDEEGHLISDVSTNPEIRSRMMEKRMKKMDSLRGEMPPNLLLGDAEAELSLIGWGSTANLLSAIVEEASLSGLKINALAIRSLWPFLSDQVAGFLKKAKKALLIENNFSSQLGRLIRQETGIKIPYHCLKYDGEPFYLNSTLDVVKKVYEGKAKEREVIITPYGLSDETHGSKS